MDSPSLNNNGGTPKLLPTIPKTLEEVTPAWLSSVLSKKVSPNNFRVAGNVQEDNGFLSQILRISCEIEKASQEEGEPEVGLVAKEAGNFIVKLLPLTGQKKLIGEARRLMIEESFDVTEMKFYEIVQHDLVEELEELSPYLCPYHCSFVIEEPRRDSIIVLEDLKPQGYYTLNFGQKVSMSRIEESVRFMAKFHYAGSAIAFKRETSLSTLYPFLQGIPDESASSEDSFVFNMCLGTIGKLDDFFAGQNCPSEMRDDYKKILPAKLNIAKNIYTEMLKCPSMIHGDLWSNNILFNDNPDLNLKVIDWQMLAFGDAACDIAVLIVSMLPAEELHRANVERLLTLYLDTFEEYCVRHELGALITRSREEFSNFFFTYAMAYLFIWFNYSRYPFSVDLPKLVNVFKFLHKDVNIIPFLQSLSS